jgi:hypothetical protein
MRNSTLVRLKFIITLGLIILISASFWRVGDEEDTDSV